MTASASDTRPRPTLERSFRPDIQGMRALAVALVVLYHAGVSPLSGGFIGVDVFFVISGYLISQHLLAEYQRTEHIRFLQFYGRRIMRLLPASFLVLVVSIVYARIALPPIEFHSVSSDASATALYVLNISLAYKETSYLSNSAPSIFQHYWSLGVEEQFYLFFPLLLLLALIATKKSPRMLFVLTALLSAVSLLGCVYVTNVKQPWAFFLLPTRAWEFGLGVLVMLSEAMGVRFSGSLRRVFGWVGLAAILYGAFAFDSRTLFPGVAAVLPVFGAALLLLGGNAGRGAPAQILGLKPLQFIGGISYSLYLWHWPLLTIPAVDRSTPLSWEFRALMVVLACVLAFLTQRFVETGLRNVRQVKAWRWSALTALIGLTCVSLIASVLVAKKPVLSVNTALPVWPGSVASYTPPAPTVVGSNLVPSLAHAGSDLPAIDSKPCVATFTATQAKECVAGAVNSSNVMVLFGDSHAEQWYPTMDSVAQSLGMRLVVMTKSSCPPMPVEVFNSKLSRTFHECDTWRKNALANLTALHPSVVVVSHYLGEKLATSTATPDTVWSSAFSTLLGELPSSARTIVIGDGPTWIYPPVACLSKHLKTADACTSPVGNVIDLAQSSAEKRVVLAHGDAFIDSAQWLCPDGRCPDILWNVDVYRDVNHVSATMAVKLAPLFLTSMRAAIGTAGG